MENLIEEETDVWCFGKMDNGSDEEFKESCVECGDYYRCFKKTYGETVAEWKRSERDEEENDEETVFNPQLENFLERLADNTPSFLGETEVVLGERKLIKVGKFSVGLTIPSALNVIYPLNSEVYVVWCKNDFTLLFFGEKSFVDTSFMEKLRMLGSDVHVSTFRRVNQCGSLNVLIIPRQFTRFFNSERKVVPKFADSYSVLFVKSNLNDNELAVLEQETVLKRFTVRSSVEKIVSPPRKEWVIEGECLCGKIGKLYNGKSGLVCLQCLEKEKLF